jgi:hypothetical protein
MDKIFASITNGSFSLTTYLICMAVALICGGIAAFAASYRAHASKSFVVSLIVLPAIVQTVIMMVNGNIGTGVAVMGAFSLVRFRSVPGKARDIVAIFLTMTAGLACSAGYVAIAVLFTVLISIVMVAATYVPTKAEKELELKITVPETLNYTDAFAEVLKSYTARYRLVAVKTTAMGSLFKLTYRIEMKNRSKEKEFMDALRCRNGNLEIAISESILDRDDL